VVYGATARSRHRSDVPGKMCLITVQFFLVPTTAQVF